MGTLPEPGLDGTYRGSCAVCLTGTDTAVAFRGDAEWIIAGVHLLGISINEAALMLSLATGCDPGHAPPGELQYPVLVCRSCADASPGRFPVGPLDAIPVIVAPTVD